MEQGQRPRVIVVTGLSGAGNSTALNAFSDLGLHCIDNIPVEVLSETLKLLLKGRFGEENGLAICMDARDPKFAGAYADIRKELAQQTSIVTLFLTADSATLARRYSTTRRRHPLMTPGATLVEAISAERALLSPIEDSADAVFDLSLIHI